MTLVDVRFGKMDADDHLFVRIGDEWPGDQDSGLIYGHVSVKSLLGGADLLFSYLTPYLNLVYNEVFLS